MATRRSSKDAGMEARLKLVYASLGATLRGGYPALVSAAACGLLVLLLWPRVPRSYVAEAAATASSPSGNLSPLDDSIPWLQSDEVLRAAIANLRASQPRVLDTIVADAASGDPIAALRTQLRIARLASPDEMPRLAIGCQASRRRDALAVVDEVGRQLADHYAAQREHSRRVELQEQQRAVSQVLQRAIAAQERLEVELQGLRHAHLTSAVAASAGPSSPAPAATQRAASDPRLGELRRTLDSMKVERDRLLEVYLPAHPQIQTLSAQIQRLEDSLRRSGTSSEPQEGREGATREVRAGGRVLLEWQRVSPAQAALASGQAPLPAVSDRQQELLAAIRQSQIDLLAATHQRQQAEREWQQVEAARQQLESDPALDWNVEPARIVSTSSRVPVRPQLAAALLAASLGGLGVAWLARKAAHDLPIGSIAELRRRTSLPILGTVAAGDEESAAASPESWPQSAVRLATRGSEVVLLTFICTLLVAVALDRGTVSDLAHDPLATLSDLVQRLI